jgi:hypothetical protein
VAVIVALPAILAALGLTMEGETIYRVLDSAVYAFV